MIVCCTLPVVSQIIPKRTTLLGGSLGFNTQAEKVGNTTSKSTGFSINPSIGKFYNNNHAAGFNLLYFTSKTPDDSYKNESYGLGVFLRQYLPIGKSFYVFAEEDISGNRNKSDQNPGSSISVKDRQLVLSAYFFPGIAYSLTRHFQLELSLTQLASINYTKTKRTQSMDFEDLHTTFDTFAFQTGGSNTNLGNLSFGVKWLL